MSLLPFSFSHTEAKPQQHVFSSPLHLPPQPLLYHARSQGESRNPEETDLPPLSGVEDDRSSGRLRTLIGITIQYLPGDRKVVKGEGSGREEAAGVFPDLLPVPSSPHCPNPGRNTSVTLALALRTHPGQGVSLFQVARGRALTGSYAGCHILGEKDF